MKSATSFFNTALLKKNLLRFWPLWAVYGLIWVYILPLNCLLVQQRNWGASTDVTKKVMDFALDIPDTLQGGIIMAAGFGILAAMAMFSYLFNNRSACMIHSLPTRREGLFLTNYLSGLICLLAPNAVVWLLTLAAEAPAGYLNLYTITVWFLAQSAMCLFFYSFAVFCAMFTGHILALPAFYGILNALVLVVSLLADALMSPFLYGYAGLPERAQEFILWLTPVGRLVSDVDWNATYSGVLSGIPALAVYAVAGVIFTGLALLVYTKRHVESAGDVVAIALVRPLFKYGVAVCSALCFGFWVYEIMGMDGLMSLTFSLLLWTAIGYFVAEMLLRKSFRVLSAWKGCAVLLLIVALSVTALTFDLFGYSSRVPDQDRVESVSVYGLRSYPNDSANNISLTEVTDPDLIDRVLAVHKAVVDQHKHGDTGVNLSNLSGYTQFMVDYQLKGGSTLSREYYVLFQDGTALADAIAALALDPELTRENYGLDKITADRLSYVYIQSLYDEERMHYTTLSLGDLFEKDDHTAAMQTLYEAAIKDLEEGTLGKRYLYDNDPERLNNTLMADICFEWQADPITVTRHDGSTYTKSYNKSISITLTPQAKHTLQALTELGVLTEKYSLRTYGSEHSIKFADAPVITYIPGMENSLWQFDSGDFSASISVPTPTATTVISG